MDNNIDRRTVLVNAYGLLGDGQGNEWDLNPEYTRAITELVSDVLGVASADALEAIREAGLSNVPDVTADEQEHVFLVAVTVTTPSDREGAEKWLHQRLNEPTFRNGTPRNRLVGTTHVSEWWVAEDDRRDRSDNDAAVFVPSPFSQEEATSVLAAVAEVIDQHGVTLRQVRRLILAADLFVEDES